jgi:hypothetical protein
MTLGSLKRLVCAAAVVGGLGVVVARVRGEGPAKPQAAKAGAADSSDEIRFNRDIRPILSENCFLCHGPDKTTRKAKLRLDVREDAVAKKAIVPGDAAHSSVIERIVTTDEDDLMPPADSGKKLTAAQKELLKKWIASGAEYQPHWAYVVPTRPEAPKVKDAGWVRNPIDAFILSALEQKGIAPSKEADRRTLLRRLSLDLIGLPPTAEEVEAFVQDKSAGAYEKQVERLLASPHFGERMAVAWLDLARFADTVGYHGDQNQHNFPYRDYVIDAFNKNKPFDRFTIEQLAGDLLPNPTTEQRVATGFNRQNMMTREGGAQPKEYLAKYTADRVRTVSATWLGSTFACAECHDHKYDPITARDFYALGAYFADVKQWGVYMDYTYTPNPDLRGYSNDHPFPPEIEVESPYLRQRIERLNGKIAGVVERSAEGRGADAKRSAAFEEWCKTSAEFLRKSPGGWVTPAVAQVTSHVAPATPSKPGAKPPTAAAEATVEADGSIVFTGKARKGEEQLVELNLPAGWVSAVRVEVLPHARHKNNVTRDGAKSTNVTVAATLRAKAAGRDAKLTFYHADSETKEARFANGYEVIGVASGWRTVAGKSQAAQSAVYLLDRPFKAAEGDKLTVAVKSDNVGSARVSVSPFGGYAFHAERRAENLATALADREGAGRLAVEEAYLLSTAADADAFNQYKPLYRDLLECRGGKARTMVTEAREPLVQRVLPRGNWQDETGEVVLPAPPGFLVSQDRVTEVTPPGKRGTRLDLANWLVSKENPLTARTFVNRLWRQFFGNGLSAVADDLGAQGEPPSHPDLLDWLAVEFQEAWDVKRMVRLIVLSSAYRQSSSLRPELRDVDPNNRLLASQNPRRLEAEFVRDNALAVAGLLTRDIGGPSAHPYQPGGYYVNLQFPNRDYFASADERQYRRGVYAHWQRTFMHPMLANFDAPSREECTAARNVSNTPQQALTLLNDPSFVEAARVFAAKLLAGDAGKVSDDERIGRAYQDALGRGPKGKERESLTRFLAEQRAFYTANVEDAKKLANVGQASNPAEVDTAELAAWTSVCRVVLNLHETITRY